MEACIAMQVLFPRQGIMHPLKFFVSLQPVRNAAAGDHHCVQSRLGHNCANFIRLMTACTCARAPDVVWPEIWKEHAFCSAVSNPKPKSIYRRSTNGDLANLLHLTWCGLEQASYSRFSIIQFLLQASFVQVELMALRTVHNVRRCVFKEKSLLWDVSFSR